MIWCRFYGNKNLSNSTAVVEQCHYYNALLFFGEIRVLCSQDSVEKNVTFSWKLCKKICLKPDWIFLKCKVPFSYRIAFILSKLSNCTKFPIRQGILRIPFIAMKFVLRISRKICNLMHFHTGFRHVQNVLHQFSS